MSETSPVIGSSVVLVAINAVTAAVGSIEKRGRNQFHNYEYATAADILHKLQPLLADAGLVIVTTQKETRLFDDEPRTETSTASFPLVVAIDYEFALWHTSGAVHPDRPVITGVATCRNSKGGFDDKAANKCLTAATKYFLLNLFKIPTGDYADADADEDKGIEPTPRKTSYRARKDGDFDGIAAEVNAITNLDDLVAWRWRGANSDKIGKWPAQWLQSFNEEIYEPKLAELRKAAGLDRSARTEARLADADSAALLKSLVNIMNDSSVNRAQLKSWAGDKQIKATIATLSEDDEMRMRDAYEARRDELAE